MIAFDLSSTIFIFFVHHIRVIITNEKNTWVLSSNSKYIFDYER